MRSTHYFHIEHSTKVQNNVMYNLDRVGHMKVITINQEEEGDCRTWEKKF